MVRTVVSMREAHLSSPRLPSPKHRPIVENGTFSTGPFVRNRRDPRSGRPSEAPPTQAICQRGGRGPARRMETLPAPGSLWFLSPAGKELVRPQKCFCQGWKVSFLRDNAFHFILRRQRFHK